MYGSKFQGPYSPSPGHGGRVPPIKYGRPAPSPAPGRPRKLRFPRRALQFPYRKNFSPGKILGPYWWIAHQDPRKTVRKSRQWDAYLTNFFHMPARSPSEAFGWNPNPLFVKPVRYWFYGSSGRTYCYDGVGRIIDRIDPTDVTAFFITCGAFASLPAGAAGTGESIWHHNIAGDPAPYGTSLLGRYSMLARVTYPTAGANPLNGQGPGPILDPSVLAQPGYYTVPNPYPEWDDPFPDPWPGPAPAPKADRAPYMPPYMIPALTITLAPSAAAGGGGITITKDPHVLLPPGPRNKEKKFDLYGGPNKGPGDLAGGISEFKDLVDNIAKAIPDNPCKGLALHEKAACIADHAKDINWPSALFNIMQNEFEDRLIGKLHQTATRNFSKKGYLDHRGRGYGISRPAQRNSPRF